MAAGDDARGDRIGAGGVSTRPVSAHVVGVDHIDQPISVGESDRRELSISEVATRTLQIKSNTSLTTCHSPWRQLVSVSVSVHKVTSPLPLLASRDAFKSSANLRFDRLI